MTDATMRRNVAKRQAIARASERDAEANADRIALAIAACLSDGRGIGERAMANTAKVNCTAEMEESKLPGERIGKIDRVVLGGGWVQAYRFDGRWFAVGLAGDASINRPIPGVIADHLDAYSAKWLEFKAPV